MPPPAGKPVAVSLVPELWAGPMAGLSHAACGARPPEGVDCSAETIFAANVPSRDSWERGAIFFQRDQSACNPKSSAISLT
jgi:hypothetical protein